MKSFAATLFAAATARVMTENDFEFINFVAQHNKNYATVEEFNMRAAIFAETHAEIAALQNETSQHGHNKFSDYTREEYKSMLGFNAEEMPASNAACLSGTPNQTTVDWVKAGKVDKVQDQGQCGSCWAFSTALATSSAYAIDVKDVVYSLSTQQLVDCSKVNNQGCNGGFYYYAWDYLMDNSFMLKSDYPYTGKNGKCKYNESKGVMKTVKKSGKDSYETICTDVASIKAAIQTKPNSVAIKADSRIFQTYKSGVLTSTKCGTAIDHAVTAVGFGSEGGQDYFLVQNSWGTTWGDHGLIKIAATEGKGTCGINQNVAYPHVK
jgi:C1A family cysteine protease